MFIITCCLCCLLVTSQLFIIVIYLFSRYIPTYLHPSYLNDTSQIRSVLFCSALSVRRYSVCSNASCHDSKMRKNASLSLCLRTNLSPTSPLSRVLVLVRVLLIIRVLKGQGVDTSTARVVSPCLSRLLDQARGTMVHSSPAHGCTVSPQQIRKACAT